MKVERDGEKVNREKWGNGEVNIQIKRVIEMEQLDNWWLRRFLIWVRLFVR